MNRVLEDDLKTIIAEDLSWEKLKNKTVMITGASGMVGSYMLYVLLMLNDEKHYGIKVDAVMRNVNKLPEEIRNREDVNVVVADVTKDILMSEILIILSMQQVRQVRLLCRTSRWRQLPQIQSEHLKHWNLQKRKMQKDISLFHPERSTDSRMKDRNSSMRILTDL